MSRSLPDLRDNWCKEPGRLLETLPRTSVIVCFHNEAWYLYSCVCIDIYIYTSTYDRSVLLRSVHSILNRSPDSLLHEVLLVDDASDMSHLKEDLETYMAQYPKV